MNNSVLRISVGVLAVSIASLAIGGWSVISKKGAVVAHGWEYKEINEDYANINMKDVYSQMGKEASLTPDTLKSWMKTVDQGDKKIDAKFRSDLSQAGGSGWELVSVTTRTETIEQPIPTDIIHVVAYLKRPR